METIKTGGGEGGSVGAGTKHVENTLAQLLCTVYSHAAPPVCVYYCMEDVGSRKCPSHRRAKI